MTKSRDMLIIRFGIETVCEGVWYEIKTYLPKFQLIKITNITTE